MKGFGCRRLSTYLGDAAEHDCEQQVGAVGFLRSLCLVLEEGELALDTVPDGPLVDVVEHHEGVERKHEVLHAVDRGQEYLLQILRGLGSLWKDNILCTVVKVEGDCEGRDTEYEHKRVLDRFYPNQLHHPSFIILI